MAERNWGLWAVPGSRTISTAVPSATASQRVPPKTPIKMSGTHRPPKIPAALRKRRCPPAQKMPGNYVSYKPPVTESEESSEEEISQDARDEIRRMRARRAGEKGVLYVEPDEDEQDRRREKRTMSYDERHQTGSISLNTMYDHLKKGPCKQTGFKPRMIVYETSSEEEAEKPKPLQDYQTKLSEKEVGSTKTAEEVKEQPAIKKLAKLTDKFVSEVSKKIPEDSSDTPKPDEGRSIIETENVIPGAETKAQEIKSRKQPAAPDVAKILEPKKTSSAEAVSSHLRSDPPKEKPPNEKAPSNIEVKIKKTIEKPDTQLLDLKKKPNLQENPSKSEIQGETHFSSRETSNQEQSSSIKVDKNMNSILESSSKLQHSEADQKPVRELITKEADKINSSLNTTKTDARSLHESSDRNTKIVDSVKTAKEEKASDVKLKLPDEINLTTLDTGVSLEDPLVPAETISIDEKISPSILIRNENSIAQDLQKLADDSVSPNEKLGPKKSKKKKEIILPKEEDFSDIEDDFKFGFKDFDLVYYWTWDVANETCAICRNNLMDMDDTSRTLIVWGECGHAFHNNCMVQWTKNNPRCPLCQADWAISRIGQ